MSDELQERRVHFLKTWPRFFKPLVDGEKNFEVRKDDRNFQVGDTLVLREWNPDTGKHTGWEVRRVVTYALRDPTFGVRRGYVVMGIRG